MANEVFELLWSVPGDGYRWVEAVVQEGTEPGKVNLSRPFKTKKATALTDGLTIGASYVRKQYDPLQKYPALFRIFAEVAPTQKGILAFANEYGSLGVGVPIALSAASGPHFLSGLQGETFWNWVKHIYAMRRAVSIWDMVRARDVSGLSRHIQWEDEQRAEDGTLKKVGGWFYDSHPEARKTGAEFSPEYKWQRIEPVLDLFKPGDLLMPAQFLVQRWVNEQLKEHVSPRLLYDLEDGKPRLRIVPKNLLGAMWLQLAQAIDGNREYRTCKECGKWFEVSSDQDGRTARRVFCDDPCKSRDYRRRKERAQQLKVEGKSVKEIAKELGTDVEVIKKWVTKRKG